MGPLARDRRLNLIRSMEWQKAHRRLDVIVFVVRGKKTANEFLSMMWRRQLYVVSGNFGESILYAASKIPGMTFETQHDYFDFSGEHDGWILSGLRSELSYSLKFTDSELNEGQKFLDSVIYGDDKKFVCLLVRDAGHIAKTFPNSNNSYTSYRNSKIETYTLAAEALADMGYTVFRVGLDVEKPLISTHPKVVDYATNGMRSAFLDIFLSAHCKLFISTGTGLDEVPKIFNRQITYLNFLPIFEILTYQDVLIFPKMLCDVKTNRLLTFREIINRNLYFACGTDQYSQSGVSVIDLTSADILAVALESAKRAEGTYAPKSNYADAAAKLENIYRSSPNLPLNANDFKIAGKLADSFLEKYPNFLD